MFVDSHCHLSDERISPAMLANMIARSRAAGVDSWINGGVCPEEWIRQLEIRQELGPKFLTCFGLHPWWVRDHSAQEVDSAFEKLEAEISKADALGELGLDFYKPGDQEHQIRIFSRQLDLSRKAKKPIVLHVVKAHEEALEILKKMPPLFGGIVHSFTGSFELAKRYLDLGLTLSMGSALCRTDGYETLKKALARLPRESWVLETDSPDQPARQWQKPDSDAPPFEPSALPFIAEFAAQILNESPRNHSENSSKAVTAKEILDQCRANLVRIWPQLDLSN